MLEALQLKGGGANALIRQGTAGMLNVLSPDVDYDFSEATTLRQFQDGLDPQLFDMWPGADEHGNAAREFLPLVVGDQLHTYTAEIDYDDSDYYREIEHGPITVVDNFGPEYHEYPGRYYLAIVGCDFSDNCGGSKDFRFDLN